MKLAAVNQLVFTFLMVVQFGGPAMAFEIKSDAFHSGREIPVRHTCDGEDLSPPLHWQDLPPNTKSVALISDDPDAPLGTWVHWVLYDIPTSVNQLEEGIPDLETLASGAKHGMTDFRRPGYGGPCPPPGKPHRYYFKLYALDSFLNLPPKQTKEKLLMAMKEHVLAEAQLMGTYQRRR